MKVWEQVIVAKHKPSGNFKLYRTLKYAKECVAKSPAPDLNEWEFQHEYVWSEK